MTRDTIKAQIQDNLQVSGTGLGDLDIRVQPDPFTGWRLAVIWSGFSGQNERQRRELIFQGLDENEFQWIDLITPAEKEWMGEPILDSDLEDIPAWPEALARRKPDHPIVFPSDLDDDLSPPIIATFYSLRGGVGRSTAVAYTAWILAKKGYSVLCIDMDLEAPGLNSLFDIKGHDNSIKPKQGVVSLLANIERGDQPDVLDHIVRVSDSVELYCLPAGIPSAEYARQLRWLSPESWYREERNPLHQLIELIRELAIKPDVVLVDARTGISPINAPLLFDISDVAIVTFFPHPQAKTGTGEIVKALLKTTNWRKKEITPDIRFLVSPVPDKRSEMDRYGIRATEWISEWLQEVPEITSEEILHVVSYREMVATSDKILHEENSVLDQYAKIAEWLELFIPRPSKEPSKKEPSEQALSRDLRLAILNQLQFPTGTAEVQEAFRDGIVKTEAFEKALAAHCPLVLGRKGTGKTTVFRFLLETESVAVPVFTPSQMPQPWAIGSDGLRALEERIGAQFNWQVFWTVYTALAIHLHYEQGSSRSSVVPHEEFQRPLHQLGPVDSVTELKITDTLELMMRSSSAGLFGWDWLQRLDQVADLSTFLLYDGLDARFGTQNSDLERRRRAVEGLLAVVLERRSSLRNLWFKVLLREDIWRFLSFQNKTHFSGLTTQLMWKSLPEYLKIILKQALRAEKFKQYIANIVLEPPERLDSWGQESVYKVWNALVSERMKGTKTAYTTNWVWNRLADGNSDHTPRLLFHLFSEAVSCERSEFAQAGDYDRSIIRPRTLPQVFENVSRVAVDSLRDEFPELKSLLDYLGSLRTPLNVTDLKEEHLDSVELAREVGLLQIYDARDDAVLRYKVPDLYVKGLGMTRKGPA